LVLVSRIEADVGDLRPSPLVNYFYYISIKFYFRFIIDLQYPHLANSLIIFFILNIFNLTCDFIIKFHLARDQKVSMIDGLQLLDLSLCWNGRLNISGLVLSANFLRHLYPS
jgi:hypothetical protein